VVKEAAYVEPGQAASWCPPNSVLPTPAFLNPRSGPNPSLRPDGSEILFLLMQIICDVVTEKRKEGRNGESFVAVAKDFKVDGVSVVEEGEERDGGINRNHEQNSNDTVGLLANNEIWRRMS
jgi:hypothetical protein